jgi:hypothetical protein
MQSKMLGKIVSLGESPNHLICIVIGYLHSNLVTQFNLMFSWLFGTKKADTFEPALILLR